MLFTGHPKEGTYRFKFLWCFTVDTALKVKAQEVCKIKKNARKF